MTPQRFIEVFDTVVEAPGGIERLRELVLQLAVRGKLVPQEAEDESASQLLEQIQLEAKNSRNTRVSVEYEQVVISSLPHTWESVSIGDSMALVNGRAFKPEEWSTTGFPIVRIQNLNDPNAPYNYCDFPIAQKFYIDSGDLLLSWSGTPGTSFGAYIWNGGKAVLNQHIFRCEPRGKAFFIPYLRLAINSRLSEMIERAHGGVGLRHITKGKLQGLLIPLPPLAEQHRIVVKVDELMGMIDELEATRLSREDVRTAARDSALATLRNASNSEWVGTAWTRIVERIDDLFAAPADLVPLREVVLQLAVRGKLVPQDAEEEPATVLLRKIENDSKVKPERKLTPINEAEIPYRLPSSWTWIRLQQIANFSMGKTPPTKDSSYWSDGRGFAWVSISDMDHFRSVSETKRRVSKKAVAEVFNCQPVPAGTILMSFKLTIGKIARLGVDAYHNEAIVSLYPIVHEMDAYLFQFMPLFSSGGSSKGAIKGRTLNSNSLSNLLVALPPLAEQQRIVAKVDQLFELIERLENYLVNCEKSNKAFVSAFISNEVSRHNSSGIP